MSAATSWSWETRPHGASVLRLVDKEIEQEQRNACDGEDDDLDVGDGQGSEIIALDLEGPRKGNVVGGKQGVEA
jgi:hypothetical protein